MAAGPIMHRERPYHTLQKTAWVNQAYLQRVEQKGLRWQNRAHFLGIAARLMRHLLVDCARERNCAKRGGGARTMLLDEVAELSEKKAAEVVTLDEALNTLTGLDLQQSKMVELRFLGDLWSKGPLRSLAFCRTQSNARGGGQGPGCTARLGVRDRT